MASPRQGPAAALRHGAAVLLLGAAVLLLGAAVLALASAAWGEPDGPPADAGRASSVGRVATVEVDPEGRIRIALDAVREALAQGRWADAGSGLVHLREEYGDVLVPVPEDVAGPTPLHWPAARVVEVLLARLPPEERTAAERRWQPGARALLGRARDGDMGALEVLAREWAATPEGASALRLLAVRNLEEGRFIAAKERLERWLRARPDAAATERAAVILALVDAHALLGDEVGLLDVLARYPRAAATTVVTGLGRTTPKLRARQHQAKLRAARVRSEHRSGEGAGSRGRVLPTDPVVLWTRAYDRRGVVTGPRGAPHPRPHRRDDRRRRDGRLPARGEVRSSARAVDGT